MSRPGFGEPDPYALIPDMNGGATAAPAPPGTEHRRPISEEDELDDDYESATPDLDPEGREDES
ncbi:hypothetical protein ACFSBZ_03190 [Amnibacterium flavum]|uniref:Uncharacterized protein n=1 Tax=Amnibacterium flavum TaxID=2173173 RepID=A0A2V1HPE8_9MICO|nr:hypothetical protein [Amnibacterium flavum]PVZ94476.1 hypothetical protein DDQ50_12275 [Amnibacterium flavum]